MESIAATGVAQGGTQRTDIIKESKRSGSGINSPEPRSRRLIAKDLNYLPE
jgi:hypothetical protein